jgi:hypothetical protein
MSHAEEFEKFNADNPNVYREIVRLSREAKAKGFQRLGIRMVYERMRWEFTMSSPTHSRFKLDDNFTSFYSRLIMKQEPDLNGFFEIRGRAA